MLKRTRQPIPFAKISGRQESPINLAGPNFPAPDSKSNQTYFDKHKVIDILSMHSKQNDQEALSTSAVSQLGTKSSLPRQALRNFRTSAGSAMDIIVRNTQMLRAGKLSNTTSREARMKMSESELFGEQQAKQVNRLLDRQIGLNCQKDVK